MRDQRRGTGHQRGHENFGNGVDCRGRVPLIGAEALTKLAGHESRRRIDESSGSEEKSDGPWSVFSNDERDRGGGRFDRHSVISGGQHPFTAHETAAQSGRVVMHRPEGAALGAQVPLREGMIGIAVHIHHGVSIDSDECSATGDTDTTEAPLGLQHKHDTTVK